MTRPVYRFGTFRLDAAARELWAGTERVVLPSSAFECLAYLVEHRDRAIGRDELIAAIWGRSDVTDTQLGQAIVRVRSALGDTGREQQFVRTVPRFGYRFVAETTPEPLASGDAPAGEAERMAAPAASAAADTPVRRLPLPGLVLAALALIGAAALAWRFAPPAGTPPATSQTPPGALPPAPAEAALAVVWPASVGAPADWAWLRLGVMDLVATRLRSAGVPTMPSDNVVGLLRGRDQQAPVPAADLVPAGAWRIEPAVEQDGPLWRVRLQAQVRDRDLVAAAESGDVLSAARGAVDSLLIKLGHAPPLSVEQPERALEELARRVNAASLSGQNALAARLIEQAPVEQRDDPEIGWMLANIELRAGDYGSAERRLSQLLDRVSEKAAPSLRGRILNTLAAIHVRRDESAQAQALYREAARILPGHDDSALGLAHLGLGLTAEMEGRIEEATGRFGQARTQFEGAGNLLGVAHVDANLASMDLLRYRPGDAVPRLLDVERRFAQLGAQEELVYSRITLARAYLQLLDLEQALAAIDRCWPVERAVANERLRWQVVAVRAQVLAALGRLDEADALLADLGQRADREQDAATRALALAIGAEIAASRGQPDATVVRLAESALSPPLEQYSNDRRLYPLTWVVRLRALRRAGEIAQAASETARLVAWLEAQPDDWRLAWAEQAKAEQAWREGAREQALAHFAAALERIERLGVPEDLVAIAQPYVLALIDGGEPERAGTIAGRIAAWGAGDFRVAWAQARLYQALGRPAAARQATDRALALAGQRALPGERRAAPARP
ncbi:MAG TPA: transcriptional regulator [Dokdonella sp.]|uniref:transcriptional regulator n=1 Tax=Dokdonella sp. TaxID=2291710 RepID=UPI002BCBAC43|nr:transcriptional regulator [Dokdonella sp.]HUD41585.1 transcriptional regulator [Dokdonella sp.]